jgi:hypothetical protein
MIKESEIPSGLEIGGGGHSFLHGLSLMKRTFAKCDWKNQFFQTQRHSPFMKDNTWEIVAFVVIRFVAKGEDFT